MMSELTGSAAGFSKLFPQWIPRVDNCNEIISPVPVNRLAATLNETTLDYREGDSLPPLWHWIFFIRPVPQGGMGRDGHPKRGDFLPPVSLPRRMFAGLKASFRQPLIIGPDAERESEVIDIKEKSGAAGPLIFVKIQQRIRQKRRLCLIEEQELVYREMGASMALPVVESFRKPPANSWTETVTVDAATLFRFSAVTFNGHKIHYDRAYARKEEGYPALVVHAPLVALLLLQLVRKNTDKRVTQFDFRAMAPLFDGQPFQISAVAAEAGGISLQALRPDGKIAARASVRTG